MKPGLMRQMAKPAPGRVLMTATALCIVLIGAGALTAQEKTAATRPGDEGPKTVSNIFIDTDLREALQDIASQLEVVIIPDNSVSGVVTCELKTATLDQALEIVLAGSGYLVKKMPDYCLVCSGDPTAPSFVLVSQTRVVKLNHVKAASAVKLLCPTFQEVVQADAESNTLCITAVPEIVERIVADLEQIDRPPQHCRLDARIVVMEHEDLLELGIQWGWPQVKAGIFTSSDYHGGELAAPDWPWGLQIGYTTGKEFTDSLLMMLNLLTQNENATVLASPQLMTQDGKEAEIAVNTEEYFEIVSQGYYTQSTLQKVESGTLLKITPHIGENGEITLQILTEVSDVVGRGEKNLPVITRRTTQSTVRVENGGTAAVAGLMLSRTRLADSGVPGLGSLKGIGLLFRKDTDSRSSRQVAVFVTARVMSKEDAEADRRARARPTIEPVGPEFRQQLQESLRRMSRRAQSAEAAGSTAKAERPPGAPGATEREGEP